MAYYVYILRNNGTNQLYPGQTSNLQRRLKEHNCHAGSRQKHTGPGNGTWELLHVEEYESKALAIRREKFLKSGTGRKCRNISKPLRNKGLFFSLQAPRYDALRTCSRLGNLLAAARSGIPSKPAKRRLPLACSTRPHYRVF